MENSNRIIYCRNCGAFLAETTDQYLEENPNAATGWINEIESDCDCQYLKGLLEDRKENSLFFRLPVKSQSEWEVLKKNFCFLTKTMRYMVRAWVFQTEMSVLDREFAITKMKAGIRCVNLQVNPYFDESRDTSISIEVKKSYPHRVRRERTLE